MLKHVRDIVIIVSARQNHSCKCIPILSIFTLSHRRFILRWQSVDSAQGVNSIVLKPPLSLEASSETVLACHRTFLSFTEFSVDSEPISKHSYVRFFDALIVEIKCCLQV